MINEKRKIDIASKLFKLGTGIFISLGLGHLSGSLIDILTPFLFTPVDIRIKNEMINATIIITDRMSLWDAWIGFNLSHGLGVMVFGFVFLLLAHKNFNYIITIKFIYPLSVFIAMVYSIIAVIFWFYAPAIGCFSGLLCFVISFALMKNEWLRR